MCRNPKTSSICAADTAKTPGPRDASESPPCLSISKVRGASSYASMLSMVCAILLLSAPSGVPVPSVLNSSTPGLPAGSSTLPNPPENGAHPKAASVEKLRASKLPLKT